MRYIFMVTLLAVFLPALALAQTAGLPPMDEGFKQYCSDKRYDAVACKGAWATFQYQETLKRAEALAAEAARAERERDLAKEEAERLRQEREAAKPAPVPPRSVRSAMVAVPDETISELRRGTVARDSQKKTGYAREFQNLSGLTIEVLGVTIYNRQYFTVFFSNPDDQTIHVRYGTVDPLTGFMVEAGTRDFHYSTCQSASNISGITRPR